MIYVALDEEEPVRQGDIFVRLPRIEVNLARILAVSVSSNAPSSKTWAELEHLDESSVLAAVRPVMGVVISQDCDATRSEDISFCEARPFTEVEGKAKNTTKPKAWASILTTHARVNQKWFYLPPDPDFGVGERMAVDFRVPIRVARESVETMRASNRVGRLNEMATAHFRERIAEFFRRYPYDEWYALSADEFSEYDAAKMGDAEPFPWQRRPQGETAQ